MTTTIAAVNDLLQTLATDERATETVTRLILAGLETNEIKGARIAQEIDQGEYDPYTIRVVRDSADKLVWIIADDAHGTTLYLLRQPQSAPEPTDQVDYSMSRLANNT